MVYMCALVLWVRLYLMEFVIVVLYSVHIVRLAGSGNQIAVDALGLAQSPCIGVLFSLS
jgi:hypothetical protein